MLPSGYPGVVRFTESAKAVRSVQNYEDMWSYRIGESVNEKRGAHVTTVQTRVQNHSY